MKYMKMIVTTVGLSMCSITTGGTNCLPGRHGSCHGDEEWDYSVTNAVTTTGRSAAEIREINAKANAVLQAIDKTTNNSTNEGALRKLSYLAGKATALGCAYKVVGAHVDGSMEVDNTYVGMGKAAGMEVVGKIKDIGDAKIIKEATDEICTELEERVKKILERH